MPPARAAGAWILSALAAGLGLAAALWLAAALKARLRQWIAQAARRTVHRFGARIHRRPRTGRALIRQHLLQDPAVARAVAHHCAGYGLQPAAAWRQVGQYLDEIVPAFSVLWYYRMGYGLAKSVLRSLYRVSAHYRDPGSLEAIPRRDVVVYLMNHRSNADYVLVAFVLARAVRISYAVGEWARVWPLEYLFKAFGAYFVRRRYPEPLYHTVLERYVQLVTSHGVAQGIFLEGGLSRDGRLGVPKLGLLDYLVGTLREPTFDRDIWLVPVALNYDRVLEDRSLIQELATAGRRPPRWRQLAEVSRSLASNLARRLAGRTERLGRAAVAFGSPLSVRTWLAARPGVLERPRPERRGELEQLARAVMEQIGRLMPVTPVPLVAAALLSFGKEVIFRHELLDRLDQFRDHLMAAQAELVRPDRPLEDMLDQVHRTLALRRLAAAEGGAVVVFPRQRPLLEFYANSIRHLLPPLPPPPAGALGLAHR